RAGRDERRRGRLARTQAQAVRPGGTQRRQEAAQDRRRPAAVELRQPRAGREKADPLNPPTSSHSDLGKRNMAKETKVPVPLPATKKKLARDTHVIGQSRIFTPQVIDDIHIKSELGRYRMQ